MLQLIADVITAAKKEEERVNKRILSVRETISPEDFKTLLELRANTVLAQRRSTNAFIVDNDNRPVINMLYTYITRVNCPLNPFIGIILNGTYGCGKSVLIEAFCMVLNDLTYTESNKIEFVHAIELAEQIRNVGVIPYSKKPLLIQDLGKEKKEINHFGTLVNPISELLAIRAEYGALTFGSTNMKKTSFKDAYKEFISKRITEHVNLVLLPGEDRRRDFSINQP